MNRLSGFCFITDRSQSKNGILHDVGGAIAGGASMVQYRDKETGMKEMEKTAAQLLLLTRKAGIPLIINDSVEVALATGADGVHLGQGDMAVSEARKLMPMGIIGITVHNAQEAIKAEKEGADYLGASPIFSTSTKKDAGTAIGIEGLRQIRAKVKLPILAIGGITLENVQAVISAGANGICAIFATSGGNVRGKVRSFSLLFK